MAPSQLHIIRQSVNKEGQYLVRIVQNLKLLILNDLLIIKQFFRKLLYSLNGKSFYMRDVTMKSFYLLEKKNGA